MAQPGPGSQQAGALTAEALARVREVLRLPRRGRGGRMESAETAHRRAALDLAIIGALADGGLRRSEAVALTWSDVELWPDGTGRLTIQRGKNQVEPATVAVTEATARALREILPKDADPAAPVFGLTGEALANRVRAAARAAGLGDGFTGHSGRIGMARRMVAAGAPNAAVQRQGRWKHGDMVARHTRGEGRRGGAEMAEPTTTPCRQSRDKLLQSAGQKLDPITSKLKPLLFQKEDQTNAGLTRTGIHRDIFVQHQSKERASHRWLALFTR